MQITIAKTSVVSAADVPEEVAKDLQDTYDALASMPVTNQANVDFLPEGVTPADASEDEIAAAAKAARLFVKQGKAWAAAQGEDIVFSRRGDVKSNPTRVSFRVYRQKSDDEKEAARKVAADKKAAKKK